MNIFMPEMVIQHHSLTKDSKTVSWSAIRRYHTQALKWKDIGYHYGIELINDSYEILLGRFDDESGAHCYKYNKGTIGICWVGNFDNNKPSEEMWKKGVELNAFLLMKYKLTTGAIKAHNEFSKKTCPGFMFDMDKLKLDVGNELEKYYA